MGKFKEEKIDADSFEAWFPTTQELDEMQRAAALGHMREFSRWLEEKAHRMKYYGDEFKVEDFDYGFSLLTDLRRTLE